MNRMKRRITACIVCAVMTGMSMPYSAELAYSLTASAAEETIAEAETLNADRVVEGDLLIQNDLDLNGFSLTVKGNVFVEAGAVSIGSGTMHVTGDFLMRPGRTGWSYGELRFTEDDGVLDVDGSVEFATKCETAAYQNTGRLRVGQDLRVWSFNTVSRGYAPGGTHVTEFKGEVQHAVEVTTNTRNYLHQVEVTDGGSLYLTGGTTGFTLLSDARIAEGSKIAGDHDLILNGNKLTFEGDFTQEGEMTVDVKGSAIEMQGTYFQSTGVLNIEDGTVHIAGDYELRPGRTGWGSGELRITDDKGLLDVDGSVELATRLEVSGYQNAGRLRIGKDLHIWSYNGSCQCYAPYGTHVTEFKGEGQHEVDIAANHLNYLDRVEVTGGGSLYLTGQTMGFTLLSDARIAGGSTLRGDHNLVLNGNKVTVEGDLTQEGSLAVDVTGSTLEIQGNYFQGTGVLNVADGSVHIGGDYELRPGRTGWGTGELRITDDKGLLDVDGSVELATQLEASGYQNAGRLRIGKDLHIWSYNGCCQCYAPTGTHVTEFKGSVQHDVEIAANHLNYIDRVEVTDGGSLYLTGATSGFTLLSDAVFAEGSQIVGKRDLNLNGHTVLTEGDFRQAGEMTVNLAGSKMQINGNYWQDTGVLDIGSGTMHIMGDYELRPGRTGWGSGELRMAEAAGVLDVDGSVEIGTTVEASAHQNNGKLRVGKDLRVWSFNGSTQGYAPFENHITEFKGAGQHEVELYATNLNYLDQVEVTGGGSLALIGPTSGFTMLTDARFAGGSILHGERPFKLNGNTVTVEGDFKQDGALTVDLTGGKLNVAGDYWQNTGTLEIGSGTLNIAGNYELRPGSSGWSSGSLHMTDKQGALIVGGSAELASTQDDYTQLTAGTVSIGKDLRVWSFNGTSVSYPAREDHITEFRGGAEHEVAFYKAGPNYLNDVKLGLGDSITFTEHFGEIAADADSAVTVDPETIAAAEGRTVKGIAAGAGTMTLKTGDDTADKALVVGDSETEAVFAGASPAEDPLTVRLNASAQLKPGQAAEIPVTIGGKIPEGAWMAFVPSGAAHTVQAGLDAKGEAVQLVKITGETVTMTAPETAGLYDIRVYDGEDPAAANEIAYQIIRVGDSAAEPAKPLLGDVNLNGIVNAEDATALLIAAAKLGTGQPSGLSPVQESVADVDGSKVINANDATAILRYAAARGTANAGSITDYV